VERVAVEADGFDVGVWDLDLVGVGAVVEPGIDLQAGAGGGRGDQVEQGYKQVKDELGWADFQVRSDLAIRRHQALVNCAFSFCWAPGSLTTRRRMLRACGQGPAAESWGPRATATGTVTLACWFPGC
jgi:hypothetical protein